MVEVSTLTRPQAGRSIAVLVVLLGLVIAVPVLLFIGDRFLGGDCALAASGPVGTAPRRIAGVRLDAEQARNAQVVAGVARRRGLIERASAIALMTAMQESGLRNLNHGDRDSLGLFQQRPSQGWGTPAQVRDPVYASNRFFERLVRVSGWQTIAMWRAAQAVQRSANGQAYAQHQTFATKLAAALFGHNAGVTCAPDTGAAGGVGAQVVARSTKQLGVPYSWGGGGPSGPSRGIAQGAGTVGFDCSGLTQYAWAPWTHLDRIASDQYHDGRHLPVTQAQPGDLVFWATNTSDWRTIHHVAIYAGHHRIVEAPHTGTNVGIRTLGHEAGLMPDAVRPRASS
jgi:cell wall-associated NlpC family hydrolase